MAVKRAGYLASIALLASLVVAGCTPNSDVSEDGSGAGSSDSTTTSPTPSSSDPATADPTPTDAAPPADDTNTDGETDTDTDTDTDTEQPDTTDSQNTTKPPSSNSNKNPNQNQNGEKPPATTDEATKPDPPSVASPLRIPLPTDQLSGRPYASGVADLRTEIARACGGGQCISVAKVGEETQLDGLQPCDTIRRVDANVQTDEVTFDPYVMVPSGGTITVVVNVRCEDVPAAPPPTNNPVPGEAPTGTEPTTEPPPAETSPPPSTTP